MSSILSKRFSSLFVLTGFLLALCCVGRAFGQAGQYTINGTVANAEDGRTVYLKKSPAGDGFSGIMSAEKVDSTTVQDGKFTFSGRIAYPQYYLVSFEHIEDNTESRGGPIEPTVGLFLESGTIRVTTDLSKLPSNSVAYFQVDDRRSLVEVKGSESHRLYRQFEEGLERADARREDIYSNEYIPYLRSDRMEDKGAVSEGVSMVNRMDEAAEERDQYVRTFIADHSDSFVAIHVARNFLGNYTFEEIEQIENLFSDRIRQSSAWSSFSSEAQRIKQSAVGAQFPDATLVTPEGKEVNISDYVANGNYVQLEFWASWCGPCRAEIPRLKELYEVYHPEGYQIVNISVDDDEAAWRKAMKEENMPWPQLWNPEGWSGLSEKYNFNGIPFAILISPDGEIVTRQLRFSYLNRELIRLYGDKFTEGK